MKENGITDIAISTNNSAFDYLDIEKLVHINEYTHDDEERHKKSYKSWLNAYYPTNEPACYIPGDIYFSENAIKTIVETEVKDTMFFCVRDLSDGRPCGINIKGREPLAYKVENQEVFRKAINDLLQMVDEGKFTADPIAWNLYRQINGLEIAFNWSGSDIFTTKGDYIAIDDYSTDIDRIGDIPKLENLLKILKGEIKMIKVEVKEHFCINSDKFNEFKNMVRKNKDNNKSNELYVGDTFECTEEMDKYLENKPNKIYHDKEGNNNPGKRDFVKFIEIIPEVTEEVAQVVVATRVEEADEQGKKVKGNVKELKEEPKKKTTKRKITNKKTTKKKED